MWTPVKVVKISGNSMAPYAKDGDYAVSTKFFFSIAPGDVLVFRSPVDGTILIKRVRNLENSGEGTKFFMEGDNRMRSTDSNTFGTIAKKSIIGKVIFIARQKRTEPA